MSPQYKQVIVIRKDLNMRKGKMAAQAAHAVLGCALGSDISEDILLTGCWGLRDYWSLKEQAWLAQGMAKIVVGVDTEAELEKLIAEARKADIKVFKVTDAGRTEFKGPTVTCAAFGPEEVSVMDKITGHLKLL